MPVVLPVPVEIQACGAELEQVLELILEMEMHLVLVLTVSRLDFLMETRKETVWLHETWNSFCFIFCLKVLKE